MFCRSIFLEIEAVWYYFWNIPRRRLVSKTVLISRCECNITCKICTPRSFDYIPLLGLSIPIEFVLSDSSKTACWASCMLRVESWLWLDNLTDFYCWLFFVLNFIFHFSIFILTIQLKHYSVSDVKGAEIFISKGFFFQRFISPELFENLIYGISSELRKVKVSTFSAMLQFFKENVPNFTWKFDGFYRKM